MWKYYIQAFEKITDFDGVATRAEYWSFIFFIFLIQLCGFIVGSLGAENLGIIIIILVPVIHIIPGITLSIRRMHDIGWSGWWSIIPYITQFSLFISPDTLSRNDYISGVAYLFIAISLCSIISTLFYIILTLLPSKENNNKYLLNTTEVLDNKNYKESVTIQNTEYFNPLSSEENTDLIFDEKDIDTYEKNRAEIQNTDPLNQSEILQSKDNTDSIPLKKGNNKELYSFIKILCSISLADGDLSNSEYEFIQKICFENNITKSEFEWIINNSTEIDIVVPKADSKKIEYLFEMVRLCFMDDHLHEKEYAMCKLIAIQFGYKHEVIDVILDDMLELIKNNIEQEKAITELLEILEK